MPARNTINNGVRYSKLASDDDGYIDLQVRERLLKHLNADISVAHFNITYLYTTYMSIY